MYLLLADVAQVSDYCVMYSVWNLSDVHIEVPVWDFRGLLMWSRQLLALEPLTPEHRVEASSNVLDGSCYPCTN